MARASVVGRPSRCKARTSVEAWTVPNVPMLRKQIWTPLTVSERELSGRTRVNGSHGSIATRVWRSPGGVDPVSLEVYCMH